MCDSTTHWALILGAQYKPIADKSITYKPITYKPITNIKISHVGYFGRVIVVFFLHLIPKKGSETFLKKIMNIGTILREILGGY